ncbi:DAD family protein [Colletotrichum scovillei]|uniref:DAD family protein n=1 Tax=Colletotrichum scovillei TaxID=1209932 RepID=UPI0015C2D61D|nr:DAD family protein [Colletotrichum scovillei]KAF4782049.1 DAD family protein [Colletotrichum scovillei]
MAPKRTASSQKAAPAAAAPAVHHPEPPTSPAGPTAAAAIPGTMTSQPKAVPITMTPKSTGSGSGAQNWDQVLANIYNHYVKSTPQRTKLIDVFMAFLVVVGALQFLYCVVAGNYVCLFLYLTLSIGWRILASWKSQMGIICTVMAEGTLVDHHMETYGRTIANVMMRNSPSTPSSLVSLPPSANSFSLHPCASRPPRPTSPTSPPYHLRELLPTTSHAV